MPDHGSEFRFAVPELISGIDPDNHPATPSALDRLVQRENDCKIRVGTLSHPMAKFPAMDLLDIKYHVSQICDYVKRMVPYCCTLAGLVPRPGERIDPLFLIG